MDNYIYGIIKENGVSGLRKVSYPIKKLPYIPDSELCRYHNYATCFYEQYSDCLVAKQQCLLKIKLTEKLQ